MSKAQRGRRRAPVAAPLYRTRSFLAATALALLGAFTLIGLSLRTDAVPPSTSALALPDRTALGDPAAPVTVEVWSDFQCPYCRVFAQGAQQQLIRTEVARGSVRLVHRSFAFLGAESELAAQAASCAAEQGRFWQYHDKLFAEQAGENRGTFRRESLDRFARDLGLEGSFGACLASGRYAAIVRDERAAGERAGVRATPTLFVNGRKVEGAVGIDELRRMIVAAR